jgi:hypothetical protein
MGPPMPGAESAAATPPRISVVLVAYEMRRELPRTIQSLSPAMQRGIEAADYELVVVDNGSAEPPDREQCEAYGASITWLRIDDASPSPVAAINQGIAAARAPLVGAMIDGARLASPGVLRHALLAARLHRRPVIATLGFHLGSDLQRLSIADGYDRDAEDALLAEAGWTEDGYRLFGISTFAGSSRSGWFETPQESNALFMPAELWAELGGFDERFAAPGGGFANTDVFTRACELPTVRLVVLLGEGTFHQLHGGVVTNDPLVRREALREEYRTLRGREPGPPAVRPTYLGTPHAEAVASISHSPQRGAKEAARERARRYLVLLTDALASRAGGERRPRARLNAVANCVSAAIAERVPGDLVQCGLRRAETAILLGGALAAWDADDRGAWLLEGVDDPEARERVTSGLERLDLLGDRVRVVAGPLEEGLAGSAIERIALLLLGADEHDSTLTSLTSLYDRLSPGAFVIVDGYRSAAGARAAVDAFRERRAIGEPLEEIAESAIRWRVGSGAAAQR